MRKRLLLILSLSVLAMVSAGAVTASADLLGQGQGDVNVDLPGGADLPDVTGALPVCTNTQDDDGDGLADLADPGCSGPTDSSEEDPAAPPTTPEPERPRPPRPAPPRPAPARSPRPPGPRAAPAAPAAPAAAPTAAAATAAATAAAMAATATAMAASGGTAFEDPPLRNPDGTPTNSNPSLSVADFGASPIGVPNFMIDQFEIPPFLLPLYQACGTQYGIPWEILASINRIETAFGTNMGPSTAGALGWMQFMPATWKAYGVDANDDGREGPLQPRRRDLRRGALPQRRRRRAGPSHRDLRLQPRRLVRRRGPPLRAQYGKLPEELVGSLTGLTEGAHFPVAADARYADDLSEREVLDRAKGEAGSAYSAGADAIQSSPTRRGINIYSEEGAPVVAVNDGVIKEIGESDQLGKYIVLQDAYGNRFTYSQLGDISDVHPVPEEQNLTAAGLRARQPRRRRGARPARERLRHGDRRRATATAAATSPRPAPATRLPS